VKKQILIELEDKLKEILNEIANIPDEEVVGLIREDREGK
jgi:hypothetical protein